MKSNQKGFSAVEFILLMVIVGLIGGVGWFVWRQSKGVTQQEPTGVVSNQETDTVPQPLKYPKEYIKSYSLPTGWREKKCKDNVIAIIPTGTVDPNCSADQPNTIVSIATVSRDVGSMPSPMNCSDANKQNVKNKNGGYNGDSSFVCKDITVDGKAGFKTVVETTKDSFYGEATVTEYYLNVDNDIQILTSYIKYPVTSDDLSTQISALVNGLTFKE